MSKIHILAILAIFDGVKMTKMHQIRVPIQTGSDQIEKTLIAYDTVQRSLSNVLLVSCQYLLPFGRR